MIKRTSSETFRRGLSDGLLRKPAEGTFVCHRCGACCRIRDGIVRVSEREASRIAAFLGMDVDDFIANETELAPDRKSLMLKSRSDGACVYLTGDNLCRINPAKPDKCRTFPLEWANPDSSDVCPAFSSRTPSPAPKDGGVVATRSFSMSYKTPPGFSDMVMHSDGEALTGLHFVDSRKVSKTACKNCDLPVFRETRRWLDEYFAGHAPGFSPPYRIDGLTPFRKNVIDAMLKIPYGKTVTYGDIAAGIAQTRGLKRMSAQAVGGAVGWNPICLIIPCHRVIGANGALVGYGGGIKNKVALLKHERNSRHAATLTERNT